MHRKVTTGVLRGWKRHGCPVCQHGGRSDLGGSTPRDLHLSACLQLRNHPRSAVAERRLAGCRPIGPGGRPMVAGKPGAEAPATLPGSGSKPRGTDTQRERRAPPSSSRGSPHPAKPCGIGEPKAARGGWWGACARRSDARGGMPSAVVVETTRRGGALQTPPTHPLRQWSLKLTGFPRVNPPLGIPHFST